MKSSGLIFQVKDQERESIKTILKRTLNLNDLATCRYAVFFAVGREYQVSRRWDKKRFIELSKIIIERFRLPIFYIGSEQERY